MALQETAAVPFTGIELRTAGIQGTITVEDHPIRGVDGHGERRPEGRGAHGASPTPPATTWSVSCTPVTMRSPFRTSTPTSTGSKRPRRAFRWGLRETATVSFQGDLLRTAEVSGRVSVEGVGLDGITVTLSGDADATEATAGGGHYAFTGLAAGAYTVAIDGWDGDAYSFAVTEADVPVAEGASVIWNFDGEHARTASISGMLFVDEVDADGMHTEGEPPLAMTPEMSAALAAAKIPGVPLMLQGPRVDDVQVGFAMPDGSYAFEDLMAGSYRVLLNMDAEGLAEAISRFGYRFSGEPTGRMVNVAASADETVDFPFRIVTQTIVAGAVMGNAEATGHPVPGVSMAMYPTAADAAAGTNLLGTAMTDTAGAATFHFPRAMDIGPGGQGTDHLVFIRVTGIGPPDLAVSDNAHIEVEYEATDRVGVGADGGSAAQRDRPLPVVGEERRERARRQRAPQGLVGPRDPDQRGRPGPGQERPACERSARDLHHRPWTAFSRIPSPWARSGGPPVR